MKKGLILLILGAWLAGGCAEMNSSSRYRGSSGMIHRASTCATCGATIKDDYFYGSTFKAMGPGSY